MALAKIFAQEKSVDARRVAPHDHVLIVVGENLRLNEVARAQQIRHRLRLAHTADRALPEPVVVLEISAFQFLAGQSRNLFTVAKSEMPRDVGTLESAQRSQPDIIKLREQKRVHEMSAVDGELRIINCLLGDLQPGWPRAQKSAAAPPIQFRFQFFRPRDEKREVNAE